MLDDKIEIPALEKQTVVDRFQLADEYFITFIQDNGEVNWYLSVRGKLIVQDKGNHFTLGAVGRFKKMEINFDLNQRTAMCNGKLLNKVSGGIFLETEEVA